MIPPLNAAQRLLVKAEKILAITQATLLHAITLNEMWERCADKRDILDTMKGSHEAFGFTVVRIAIYRDFVITLLTVLEKGDDRSACIPALLNIAEDNSVVKLMKERSMRPIEVERRIATAKSKFASLVDSGEVKALRKMRNKLIAHVEYRNVAHNAKYGDERKMLERTIPIFEDLAVAIKDRDFRLEVKRDQWCKHSDAFWRHVARPR